MKKFLLMIKYRQFRWSARLTGILGMVFFISYFTAEGINSFGLSLHSKDLQVVILFFFLCLIAYVLSWSVEIIGGILLTLTAIFLPYYVYLKTNISHLNSCFYYSLPFLLPGILFITAWWIKVVRKSPKGD
ncbi:MAG: hypothetical protein WBH71_05940 [Bacteroidales bacterium]|jgi:hypothetical protein|nr:hypothetical protein [Bacteroidales bacterium]MDI9592760.1 hypothetical protein [Bacteroidota bacterium]NLH32490.1 hypothetical protein [Lentimicrobium sp.]MBP7873758.1 hypothetical protein [Bacteroidales bacterium]MCO6467984.1 hypothetical protein [Bacteroidales bacterium]